jgi:hypothetical protein
MQYPGFFDTIAPIILHDELSKTLGTFENGIVEFNYLDIVKMAGHSCATVAGAYLCTAEGLRELYDGLTPKRGEIGVWFKENVTDGVAGVIGSVIANITGATTDYGFKGLGGGKYSRVDLMRYNQPIDSSVRFVRLDSGEFVDVSYDPSAIPMTQPANQEEFGKLWQERVHQIFINKEKLLTITKGNINDNQ